MVIYVNAHIDPTKNQMVYYHILINLQNHQPQTINQLPKIINEPLSRNSSIEEVFNLSKDQYEKALRYTGYSNFELKINKTSIKQTKRNRQRNSGCFNPPFSRVVSTNVGKSFPNMTSPICTLQQALQYF